jgi:H+-transporting ATPase
MNQIHDSKIKIKVHEMIKSQDTEMSLKGYKTIAVAVSEGGGPMKFVGIIPMLDPPREDTQVCLGF